MKLTAACYFSPKQALPVCCISPGFLKKVCDNLKLKLRQRFKQAINDMIRIFSSSKLIVK